MPITPPTQDRLDWVEAELLKLPWPAKKYVIEQVRSTTNPAQARALLDFFVSRCGGRKQLIDSTRYAFFFLTPVLKPEFICENYPPNKGGGISLLDNPNFTTEVAEELANYIVKNLKPDDTHTPLLDTLLSKGVSVPPLSANKTAKKILKAAPEKECFKERKTLLASSVLEESVARELLSTFPSPRARRLLDNIPPDLPYSGHVWEGCIQDGEVGLGVLQALTSQKNALKSSRIRSAIEQIIKEGMPSDIKWSLCVKDPEYFARFFEELLSENVESGVDILRDAHFPVEIEQAAATKMLRVKNREKRQRALLLLRGENVRVLEKPPEHHAKTPKR